MVASLIAKCIRHRLAPQRFKGRSWPNADVKRRPSIYDGVDAPPTASMCQSGCVQHHL